MPWVYDLSHGWVWVAEAPQPYYTQIPYYQYYPAYHYFAPLPQPPKRCKHCGEELIWVPQFTRWWCPRCIKYR